MRVVYFYLLVVFFVGISNTAFGGRQLEEAEVVQILQELTKEPMKTWVTAGTIEAVHEEYKPAKTTDLKEINNEISQKINECQNNLDKTALTEDIQKMKLDAIPFNTRYKLSNEYNMTSVVTLKYDGDRFYWEINVESRTDSVKPGKELTDNFMTDEFNLEWNAKRIFAWDGQNYTTYSSGNQAVIDSKSDSPRPVNGPLTAGVIPWGYKYYTYENLMKAGPTATEDIVDGQIQVTLTLNDLNGMFTTFVLDAEKNYALISHSIEMGGAVFTGQYDNYINVNDHWVPTTILLEKFEAITNRLLKRDLWNFTSIDSNVPAIDSFEIKFDDDAIVEYVSDVTKKPAMYRNWASANTEELLAERLAYAANQGSQKQNCATAALKYAVGQLDKEVADLQLAELVSDSTGDTSLLEMKQFAQGLGLYCKAVTTDLDTLKNLDNCQVILYIPGRSHFVVLESIDDKYVRVIDLANDKFYYRTDINFFNMDWTQGIALLISNNNITGNFTDINNEELAGITGASGYSCTLTLQEYNVSFCQVIGGLCSGDYVIFWERDGCELAESGSCSTTKMERTKSCFCLNNPYQPTDCTGDGEWIFSYMRACN